MSDALNPEQKKLYNLYALFGASLVLCVLPYVSAAILCLVFFTWLLIAAYIIRGKTEEHGLIHNHTTYIIRSIWIGALISLATTCAASFYMIGSIDYAPFQPCADTIAGMGVAALESMEMKQFYGLIEPCLDDFIGFNRTPLMIAVGIGAAPPLIYLAYRFIKGVSRATKGYRLANPKAWF